MAKIRLHAPFTALHGKMGDLVFRTTRNGTTSVIRKADMSNVEWSPAQIAQRQRFREARLFAFRFVGIACRNAGPSHQRTSTLVRWLFNLCRWWNLAPIGTYVLYNRL